MLADENTYSTNGIQDNATAAPAAPMTKRDHALACAASGFPTFRLRVNSKLPLEAGWPDAATTDPETIARWWTCPETGGSLDYNIGALMNDFVGVDVDVKNGKRGLATMARLCLDFGETLTTRTPTSGYHLIFKNPGFPVANAAPIESGYDGVDIRGRNGFLVGPGSTIDGVPYTTEFDLPIADCPAHVVRLLTRAGARRLREGPDGAGYDIDSLEAEVARQWLRDEAPIAIEGSGGDNLTFRIACRMWDLGLTRAAALEVLLDNWNDRCLPPWTVCDLEGKVASAYKSAQSSPGTLSPSRAFESVVHVPAPAAFEHARFVTAGACDADAPIPLFTPPPAAKRFPIEHLGRLSDVAAAIARKIQVPEATAGQSVLAVASLAAQAHTDVKLPFGQTRPVSLFFVTAAASGDRKSSADEEALRPVAAREKALHAQFARDWQAWNVAKSAWSAERKKIEADRNTDHSTRQLRLERLGPEPLRPLSPFLTTGDLTLEGLVKTWTDAHPALGIFSAEGGQFVGGHGLNEENRLRTAAMLSELWDGKPVKRVRAADGVTTLRGRRLAAHIMLQPHATTAFLGDQVLRDQGLLSRFLVAAPQSLAGTRLYREADPADEATICAYGALILGVLERAPLTADNRNELTPRAIPLSAGATAAWVKFSDDVERRCGGELKPIGDLAAKIPEHAARIAAVLTIIADAHAIEVSAVTMENALALADWYLQEAARLAAAGLADPQLLKAATLLDWLQREESAEIDFRDICRRAPNALREKRVAQGLVSILTDHGWLVRTSERPLRYRVVPSGGEPRDG